MHGRTNQLFMKHNAVEMWSRVKKYLLGTIRVVNPSSTSHRSTYLGFLRLSAGTLQCTVCEHTVVSERGILPAKQCMPRYEGLLPQTNMQTNVTLTETMIEKRRIYTRS